MGFVDVPVRRKVGLREVQIQLDGWVASVPSWELEGVVVETVNADLAACVLGLVPKVGHNDAGPLAVADRGADGTDHFDLPRAVVERFRESIVAPLPLALGFVVEDGVEFVQLQVASDVREPRHGNDVPVGGLNDAALPQTFLSGVGRNEGSALVVGQCRRNVGVPHVASVGREDGVFATDVEDLSVDVGGEIMLAAIAAVGGVKHRPCGVGGGVGAQVDGGEHALHFVRLGVDSDVGVEQGFDLFRGDRTASIAKTPGQKHGRDHGQHHGCSAHAGPSLGRDLKASLRCFGHSRWTRLRRSPSRCNASAVLEPIQVKSSPSMK